VSEVAKAEIVDPTLHPKEPTELAVVERREVEPNLFQAATPVDVLPAAIEVATALKKVVTKQGLVSNIQGKAYPHVEAWTMLGGLVGVFASTEWTRRTDDGQGWEARVVARTRTGDLVGAAEAQCTRSESTWKNRDDYALRAMAQTRATSRALRQPLGWVMVLAGYEATPDAEMPPPGSSAPAVGFGGDPYGADEREWGDPPGTPAKENVSPKHTAATKAQKQKLSILAGELGWDDDRRHAEAGKQSFNMLTRAEASELIEAWSARLVAGDPSSGPEGGGTTDSMGKADGAKPTSGSGIPEHEHQPVQSETLTQYDRCTVDGCPKVRRHGTDKWA